MDVVDSQIGDGDTAGGGSGRAAVLVILLDDDTVLGDSGEGDVLVGDALDGAGSAVDGLDANTCRTGVLEILTPVEKTKTETGTGTGTGDILYVPFWESLMVQFSTVTPSTVLSERPPTEPMEIPWPPVH